MKFDTATLRKLLIYNQLTGQLFWLPRTRDMCKTDRSCKIWNTRSAWSEAFTARSPKGYLIGAIFNQPVIAHRIAWQIVHGHEPDQIDHVNGVKHDNRLTNLREVNNAENHKNMGIQINNTSGCTGVSWSKKEQKWIARIVVGRIEKRLGSFISYTDAVKCRKQAEIDNNFHMNHGDRVRKSNIG